MQYSSPALVVDADPARAAATSARLAARGFIPVTVVSELDQAVAHARREQIGFAMLTAELGGENMRLVATLLAVRGVPFGFISAVDDGSDIPGSWQGRRFLTESYTDEELDDFLDGSFF